MKATAERSTRRGEKTTPRSTSGLWARLRNLFFGKPLSSSEKKNESLSIWTGVPVLGLDALASTGYGPEAALIVLMSLGGLSLHYYPYILIAVVVNIVVLYASYFQTIGAYPNGGGSYIVAKDNFGPGVAVWAAVALLLDYLLNVAIGISAGIGAVVSGIPSLHDHILLLCLIVLATLTCVNLRGVKESGLAFVTPVIVFVVCVAVTIVVGIVRTMLHGGHPHPIVAPPPVPSPSRTVSCWLLLAAFANGCTAMTGIEAVSNGVPLFRKPPVPNAQRTLTAIVAILALFLLGLAFVCPPFGVVAMNERESGYQTILSQLVAAVAGRGAFYYVALASIFIVLTYSAQTSFADFPRVCRLLAEDQFLPSAFAERGARLVYSQGIVVLAVLSAGLLIAFDGLTERLIPLFAIGAFGAFVFSQTGMVRHWLRHGGPHSKLKLAINGLGAVMTGAVLIIIIGAKFLEGAWMIVVVAPVLALLLRKIHRHYQTIGREIDQPLQLRAANLQSPLVVIPIDGWTAVAAKAVEMGMMISDRVVALHVSKEGDDPNRLKELWAAKVEKPARAARTSTPELKIVDSPYRRLLQPILDFVRRARKEEPDRVVAVIIPELAEPHWYGFLLHNQHGKMLKTLLWLKGDNRTIVIHCPWHLRDV
ncbi:MAG TPA: APC family permease [Tepidisphaeraceae bacterium]|nr:APC family permease [Tepidisphaeraceae bacterium]